MRRLAVVSLGIVVAILSGCSSSMDLSTASAQMQFGVKAAKMNLWREARFRFERAVQIHPNDASAHNNLAVAYEGSGDFEKAKEEYLAALKLDRSNPYLQKNYSRFTEFYTRNQKRLEGEAAAAGQTKEGAPPETSAPQPAPPEPQPTVPPEGQPSPTPPQPAAPPDQTGPSNPKPILAEAKR